MSPIHTIEPKIHKVIEHKMCESDGTIMVFACLRVLNDAGAHIKNEDTVIPKTSLLIVLNVT
jgi:hypothetical protein